MDLDLKSRTAVVTGASIGIGRAIAKGLALEGVRVVAVARRKDLLEQLMQEVQAKGGAAVIPVAQDITQQDAAKKLAATAIAELGHVDILVNNAGGSRPLPVNAPDSDWDEAIALNFTSYRKIAHALFAENGKIQCNGLVPSRYRRIHRQGSAAASVLTNIST